MSSSTRPVPGLPSALRACRPFSAKATRWPSCSSVRATSRRFTRLSSTTRTLPFSPLRSVPTLHLAERARHALAFGGHAVQPGAGALEAPRLRERLEIPRHAGQHHGADARGIRLERMRRAAQGVDVLV